MPNFIFCEIVFKEIFAGSILDGAFYQDLMFVFYSRNYCQFKLIKLASIYLN
jgi:hypothetical protein